MFSVLLPLCTIPIICMVTASIIETPLPFWYFTILFVYNIIKCMCNSLGLCYKNVQASLPYFVVMYFLFLVGDILLVPYFLFNFVPNPVLFVVVFILVTLIAYIPFGIFLLKKKYQVKWHTYYRFQLQNGQSIGRLFVTCSLLWLLWMVFVLGYVLKTSYLCMESWAVTAWIICWMLTWMVAFLTNFCTLSTYIPFRRKYTSLYSPLTPQSITHVNPKYVQNKNILFGLFGSIFVLCSSMLTYQLMATQNLTNLNLGYNLTCSNQTIFNVSTINHTLLQANGQLLNMLGLDILIMIVPCCVFAFFNFLRICCI